MTPEEMKKWIDNSSYEELLRKWRFGQSGDPFFEGEVGSHYVKVMTVKRLQVGQGAAVQASKNIGWEKSV